MTEAELLAVEERAKAFQALDALPCPSPSEEEDWIGAALKSAPDVPALLAALREAWAEVERLKEDARDRALEAKFNDF